jgi:hypothetical protein
VTQVPSLCSCTTTDTVSHYTGDGHVITSELLGTYFTFYHTCLYGD